MPHRIRLVVALVAVLLVAALVVVLLSLRSGPTEPDGTPTPTRSGMTTAVASPTYSPTDAYGSPEPGLAQGEVRTGTGGGTTGPAELPVGYPRTETGAVSAATNYLVWMNSLRIVDKTTADAMAAATASDDPTRRALVESFDQLRTGMDDLTADEEQPNRGAYAVAFYSPARATVYVWAPEVTSSDGQVDHAWSIDVIDLMWASGDWKLDGGLIARAGAAAVDPANPEGNPTPSEKHAILERTPADPGEIADSADQTWFEYADAAR